MGVQSSDIFTQRVTKLMKERFLTKKDMAKRLNVDYSTFWRKLNGQRNVDVVLLKQIADILGTSTAYLMGETDQPERILVQTSRSTPENVKKPLSFAYWGGIVDNTRDVVQSGDKNAIAYVSQMLREALSLVIKPDVDITTQGTLVKPSVANMPFIVGDHNESNLTLATA